MGIFLQNSRIELKKYYVSCLLDSIALIHTVVTTRYSLSQVERHPDEYKGEYDAVVLMVGANNLGQYTIKESIKVINETLNLLSKLNPGTRTYACEVSSKVVVQQIYVCYILYYDYRT